MLSGQSARNKGEHKNKTIKNITNAIKYIDKTGKTLNE